MEQEIKLSHSINITEFISALVKAQGSMKPAVYNKKNPYFNSKYADFSSCMDACRAPLSDNGLAVIQHCATIGGQLNLVTMIAHVSGQWMKGEFPLIPTKMDSQGIGSAMTYAKRYSLCGMLGIVADEDLNDDDGETADGRGKQEEFARQPPRPQAAPKPVVKISEQQLLVLKGLEDRLDDDNKGKIQARIMNNHHAKKLEELKVDDFTPVLLLLQNAVKYVEQQNKVELVNA